ncbi:pilus assembly protein TadG-related protein [Hyphococcus flavus]|uniref:Pilus assembly protein TadG-related protein n=1 Tax=Hyphococcus flavus TaxID=1866326 RepID=A0AAF0CBK2_9PROT|nr:TadE/TadG family type IV pilus assembly protein [Hyphococcus flavus]WDI31165.1 pilus assembly protein TadG-related protein [Hyphococcus flavus]
MLVEKAGVAVGGKRNSKSTRARYLTVTAKRFAKDRSGNIVFLFAFMATVLFLFAGGAVDYSRWNAVRADMVESMDAASLAMAQLAATNPDLTESELKDYGRKFFEANFNYESNLEPGWNIVFALGDEAIIGTCITGKIDTYLLGVAGIKNLNIDKCVEITKQGSGRVELALVLDVTGSMDNKIDGVKKIESLKDAVDTLLDVLYGSAESSENIKIGVVPFNANVNPGGSSGWSNAWADTGAAAYYHGRRFFHVDKDGNVDMDTKVNHFSLYNTTPGADWQGCVEARPYPLDELDIPPGGSMSSTDLNAYMAVPGDYSDEENDQEEEMYDAFNNAPAYSVSSSELTNSANFNWVPVFLPDAADCNNSEDCESDSSYYNDSGTTSYGTPWYGYYFDDPDGDDYHVSGRSIQESSYGQNHYYFVNDNNYTHAGNAQFDKYAKIVHYFRQLLNDDVTNDDFKEFLTELSISTGLNGSGSASHGRGKQEYLLRMAYVGWWDPVTLTYKGKYDTPNSSYISAEVDCPTPILPLTNVRDDIEDHIDLLYPNGNTDIAHGAAWGWRVLSKEAPFTEGIGPGDQDYEKWQKAVVIMTDGENVVGSDNNTHYGSTQGQYGFAIEERMGVGKDTYWEMRDELDDKLLRVCHRMKAEGYLVYTIMFGLDSNSVRDMFKACATKPTAPYFHDAVDGNDLEDAFGDIAADLVDLHISK